MKTSCSFFSSLSAALLLVLIDCSSLCAQSDSNLIFLQQSKNLETMIVTAAQYVDFLNAVAKTDPHHLYEPAMGAKLNMAMIIRSGKPANYYYVLAGPQYTPMPYLDEASVMRFCNWIENGQPSGDQGPETTEDGSYMLDKPVDENVVGFLREKIHPRPATCYIVNDEKTSDPSLKSNTSYFQIFFPSRATLSIASASCKPVHSLSPSFNNVIGATAFIGVIVFGSMGMIEEGPFRQDVSEHSSITSEAIISSPDRDEPIIDSSNSSDKILVDEPHTQPLYHPQKPLETTGNMSFTVHHNKQDFSEIQTSKDTPPAELANYEVGDFDGASIRQLQEPRTVRDIATVSVVAAPFEKMTHQENNHDIVQVAHHVERQDETTTSEQRSSDEPLQSSSIHSSKNSTPKTSVASTESTSIAGPHVSKIFDTTSAIKAAYKQAIVDDKAISSKSRESATKKADIWANTYSEMRYSLESILPQVRSMPLDAPEATEVIRSLSSAASHMSISAANALARTLPPGLRKSIIDIVSKNGASETIGNDKQIEIALVAPKVVKVEIACRMADFSSKVGDWLAPSDIGSWKMLVSVRNERVFVANEITSFFYRTSLISRDINSAPDSPVYAACIELDNIEKEIESASDRIFQEASSIKKTEPSPAPEDRIALLSYAREIAEETLAVAKDTAHEADIILNR